MLTRGLPCPREEGGITDELENQIITTTQPFKLDGNNSTGTTAEVNTCTKKASDNQLVGDEFYHDDEDESTADKLCGADNKPTDDKLEELSTTPDNIELEYEKVNFDEVDEQVEKLDKPDNQAHFNPESTTRKESEQETIHTTTTTSNCTEQNPENPDQEDPLKEENTLSNDVEVSAEQVTEDKTIPSDNHLECVISKDNQNKVTDNADPASSVPRTEDNDLTDNQKVNSNLVEDYVEPVQVSKIFEDLLADSINVKQDNCEADSIIQDLDLVVATKTNLFNPVQQTKKIPPLQNLDLTSLNQTSSPQPKFSPSSAEFDEFSQGDKEFCKEYLIDSEVAVATLDALRDHGGAGGGGQLTVQGVGAGVGAQLRVAGLSLGPGEVRVSGVGVGGGSLVPPGGSLVPPGGSLVPPGDILQDALQSESQEVRVYNGTGDVHQLLTASQIMTATTQAALESVLDCVKTEPEDLTGTTRTRTDHETHVPLDVRVRGMGIVTSPEGESIILSPEDLPLAPGFPNTTLASYDNPSFPTYTGAETRIYDSPYRDEGLYEGYRAPPNSTYYVSSSTPGAPTPGLSVDLPSPDSGIGPDQITPDSFEYTQSILDQNTIRRPWHDSYARANSDNEKVQIPKVYSPYGFKYYLDAPTSSSVRKEDDKVTYINKGQFYGVTLEYIRDPEVTLTNNTVKSVIMLVFREGKSQEDEIKAWQFWHQRQHSIKQRIIDVDTKNSHGLVGHIEELSHNAIAIYWNPLESFAKVNLAVQCLSTDFSTQKGVKGLPLHIQIDTFEDPRQEVGTPAFHRGYCQVKIFCDKGAERKLRDEERRAAKRRQPVNGKRRLDELYHETFERSDFYSQSDLNQPPTLFTPPEDPEKGSQLCQDFPSFYRSPSVDQKPINNGDLIPTMHIPEPKRPRIVPPSNERIMIYVRQETEEIYTPLHLVPPTVAGLIASIENKYKINAANIRFIYRKNKDGIVAKIDDDMLRHYCNEDVFLMQVMVTEGPGGEETMVYDITLSEIAQSMDR